MCNQHYNIDSLSCIEGKVNLVKKKMCIIFNQDYLPGGGNFIFGIAFFFFFLN